MASFRGSFDYSVDAKGRVNIPAKFRKALSPEAEETFVITRGPGDCLRAYPLDAWEKREADLWALSETKDTVNLKRRVNNFLTESTLDVQGRVTLTPALMKVAGITKEVTLLGMLEYIELWDRAKYSELSNSTDDFDDAFFKVEAELAGRR